MDALSSYPDPPALGMQVRSAVQSSAALSESALETSSAEPGTE